MANGVGIQATTTAAPNPALASVGVATEPPQQSAAEVRRSPQGATAFVREPAASVQVHSKVVQRLLDQNATVYGQRLAKVPLPPRSAETPRSEPKKPAGPMVAPRSLDGGRSPLAPAALGDARTSLDAIGRRPDDSGETLASEDAKASAARMPSRHGLVAYTRTSRGDAVYLTQERWLHIRQNHMDQEPAPRGKRTTTYWPTKHAVDGPTMTDQDVIGVIVDAARSGTLRTEVRDTRMAEYDLPREQRERFGVSEAKVSMAPDGLVLSAYPGAGDNVLAVYEMNDAEQAELAKATRNQAAAGTDALFRGSRPATAG